jgi:hypothetical protein
MPFSPHVKITKPVLAAKSFKVGGYDRAVSELLLQDTGYGRYPTLLEFRFTNSACHLFVDSAKDKVSSGSGYGFDRAGVALAGWFCKTFAAELKAIFDQPKFQKQLNGSSSGRMKNGSAHLWYGVYRDEKTGSISVNGMSGKDNVIEIMERSVGLTLRYIGETKDSTLYLLAPKFKRK